MKKLFLLALGMLLSLSVMAEPLNIMVFGDSLSVGHNLATEDSFWQQLEKSLANKGYQVKVLNYSKSGETTAGGLRKVKDALFMNPDCVLLELGINDAFQKVPLKDTTKNLQGIIDFLKKRGIPVLLIGMEAPTYRTSEYRDEFREMYADLAYENELLLYPFFMKGLWNDDGTQKSADYFLKDRVHPSAKGVKIMVNHILPVVEQFIAEDVAEVIISKGN